MMTDESSPLSELVRAVDAALLPARCPMDDPGVNQCPHAACWLDLWCASVKEADRG